MFIRDDTLESENKHSYYKSKDKENLREEIFTSKNLVVQETQRVSQSIAATRVLHETTTMIVLENVFFCFPATLSLQSYLINFSRCSLK